MFCIENFPMKMQKKKKKNYQLNCQPQNKLFDTSGTVIYTFELISHYRLSVELTIQCLVSFFVLNNFNVLITIAVSH